MEKAEDNKIVILFIALVVCGLCLLIFPGLKNVASRLAYYVLAVLFLIEIGKWIFVGLEIK